VQPHESLIVCAEVAGRVIRLFKDYGDTVREGEELAHLDDTDARLKLDRAKAAKATAESGLAAALAEVEKARSLEEAAQTELDDAKKADLPKTQIRTAEAKIKAARASVTAAEAGVQVARDRIAEAEAAVQQADLGVKLTIIRVPFIARTSPNGGRPREVGQLLPGEQTGHTPRQFTILERKVSLNQLAGPPAAAHLFTLSGGPAMVEVHAQISEGDIGRVAVGQDAIFTVSAYPDQTIPGKVVEVRPVPVNIQGAVFYTVLIEAENQPDPNVKGAYCLRPGMPTSSLDIVYAKHAGPDGKGLFLVPNAALDLPLDEHYFAPGAKERAKPAKDFRVIWVKVDNRTARPVQVKVGASGKYFEAEKNQDSAYSVVESWNPPSEEPSRDEAMKNPGSLPEVVINAEPPKKSRWSSLGNVLRLQ
jgi:HlyD family secretion protein